MKLLPAKFFFAFYVFIKKLISQKQLYFGYNFLYSFQKTSLSKFKVLLIPDFHLSEKIGKSITKQGQL